MSWATTWSAGEEVQQLAPWAKVVKGIPPFAELLHAANPALRGGPSGVFVCGNDAAAKRQVSVLLADIGTAVTDAGPLTNARYAEAAGFLLVQLAYAQGLGVRIGLGLIKDTST